MSRDAIAWRYVAVDIATIAIGYFILCLVVLAFIALFGALDQVEINAGYVAGVRAGAGRPR